jgi:protein gp37
MAEQTGIEWTEATWNPTVGCSIVSPGCTNCYAMKVAYRLQHNPDPNVSGKYAGLTTKVNGRPVWTGKVRLWPPTLTMPLKRRRPTAYFVDSQSDLFHEDLPDADIDRVFAVMAQCPQHTFQILTKRAARMRDYFADPEARRAAWAIHAGAEAVAARGWPLPNVWLGVSVDDQIRAEERIPDLLATPARIRFLSCEPLLGAVDLTGLGARRVNALRPCPEGGARVDWVIVGGESGPDARPMHPAWPRALRNQCRTHGVAFFLKQWGNWAPDEKADAPGEVRAIRPDGHVISAVAAETAPPGTAWMRRTGKKRAGRELDGRTWDEAPA